jgi:hypothetical protein
MDMFDVAIAGAASAGCALAVIGAGVAELLA